LLLIPQNKTEFAEICLKVSMIGKANSAPGGNMGGSKSRIKIGIFIASVLSMAIIVGATRGGAEPPDLGNNASLRGKGIFPANNPWNQRIDTAPVDSNSRGRKCCQPLRCQKSGAIREGVLRSRLVL
jgi:hypothetical protein